MLVIIYICLFLSLNVENEKKKKNAKKIYTSIYICVNVF